MHANTTWSVLVRLYRKIVELIDKRHMPFCQCGCRTCADVDVRYRVQQTILLFLVKKDLHPRLILAGVWDDRTFNIQKIFVIFCERVLEVSQPFKYFKSLGTLLMIAVYWTNVNEDQFLAVILKRSSRLMKSKILKSTELQYIARYTESL